LVNNAKQASFELLYQYQTTADLQKNMEQLMTQSLDIDFNTCEDPTNVYDRYSNCYNSMAKLINEGLHQIYLNDNFVTIVGDSMNFYNDWNSFHIEALYRLQSLHFLIIKFPQK